MARCTGKLPSATTNTTSHSRPVVCLVTIITSSHHTTPRHTTPHPTTPHHTTPHHTTPYHTTPHHTTPHHTTPHHTTPPCLRRSLRTLQEHCECLRLSGSMRLKQVAEAGLVGSWSVPAAAGPVVWCVVVWCCAVWCSVV